CFITLSRFLSSMHTAPTYIYTLSLHDALPICLARLATFRGWFAHLNVAIGAALISTVLVAIGPTGHVLYGAYLVAPLQAEVHLRSEEHTSELQSPYDLVCRLLLEKKNQSQQD